MMKTVKSTPPPSTDIEGLMEKIGVHVDDERTTDVEVFGRCPGHKKRTGHPDRSPSWSINRETGKHWCFSCGYGGDAESLIMDVLDIGPWEAAKMVRAWGVEFDDVESIVDRALGRQETELLTVPEDYLDHFVDPPAEERAARGLKASSCARYGVRWDGERGGWILPIRTPDGLLMGYQVKRPGYVRNRPARTPDEPGVQKGETWFGWHLFEGGRAIIVESPLDVVRLDSVSIPGGLAVMGQHPTNAQMGLLMSEKVTSVVIALDNDNEGYNAIDRLIMKWSSRVSMTVFNYGDIDAKDPGDMSREEIEWGLQNTIPAVMWRKP